jgi:hypothetical protein
MASLSDQASSSTSERTGDNMLDTDQDEYANESQRPSSLSAPILRRPALLTRAELLRLTAGDLRGIYDAQEQYDPLLPLRTNSRTAISNKIPTLIDELLASFSRTSIIPSPANTTLTTSTTHNPIHITAPLNMDNTTQQQDIPLTQQEERQRSETLRRENHEYQMKVAREEIAQARELADIRALRTARVSIPSAPSALPATSTGFIPPPMNPRSYQDYQIDMVNLEANIQVAKVRQDEGSFNQFHFRRHNLIQECLRNHPDQLRLDHNEQSQPKRDKRKASSTPTTGKALLPTSVFEPSYNPLPSSPITGPARIALADSSTDSEEDDFSPRAKKDRSLSVNSNSHVPSPNTPTSTENRISDLRTVHQMTANIAEIKGKVAADSLLVKNARDEVGVATNAIAGDIVQGLQAYCSNMLGTIQSLENTEQLSTSITNLTTQLASLTYTMISITSGIVRKNSFAQQIGRDRVDLISLGMTSRILVAQTGISGTIAEEESEFRKAMARQDLKRSSNRDTTARIAMADSHHTGHRKEREHRDSSEKKYNCNRCKKFHAKPFCAPCTAGCSKGREKPAGHSGACSN